MARLIKVALLVLLLLVSCERSPKSEGNSGAATSSGFPTTISAMDGWHGLRVTKSTVYGQPQCNLKFPRRFGQTPEERRLLTYVVSQNMQINEQADCDTILLLYKALDQLRSLAMQEQDRNAAYLILHSGASDMPFNLDGEVAEAYFESYMLPVLEKYRNLRSVLDDKTETDISKDICADVGWWKEVKNVKAIKRIQRLTKVLASSGSKGLVEKIHKTCVSMHVDIDKQ